MPVPDNLLNPRRKSPLALPILVLALLGIAAGAFLLGRVSVDGPTGGKEPADETQLAGGPGGAAGVGGSIGQPEPPAAPPPPPEVAMGEPLPGTDGLRRVEVEIHGSLTRSINGAIGAEVGNPLALVSGRLLVWGLNPSRDLRAGDDLAVIYSLPPGEEPMIHALRFRSAKLGKELRAYRYQPEGSPFARYYNAEGIEVEERLEDSPIDTYEQITSLLKDGRGHKGVDFKAPVGTEVKMPWSGTVVRKNWNYRYNGGSLEVRDGRGRSVIFLHLDSVEKSLRPGSRVQKGQVVARSGNTGRSTAPHLHYQVMAGNGRVLDPFDLHETWRDSLPGASRADFAATVAKLDDLLEGKLLLADPTAPAGPTPAGEVVPAAAKPVAN